MPRAALFFAALTLSQAPVPAPVAQAPKAISIDIIRGTLNGQPIFDFTLDQLTTLLGRPSGVNTEGIIPGLGPAVSYHRLGLLFRFKPKRMDPEQRCWGVTVHLSKSWDKDHSEFYLPFVGDLAPAASADWKVRSTLAALEGLNPTEETPEMQEGKWRAAGGAKLMHLMPLVWHHVDIDLPKHTARFSHERTTQFLETITLGSK